MLKLLVLSAEQKLMTEVASRKVKERVANEQKPRTATAKRQSSTEKQTVPRERPY
jgi:hypothetical protein